MTLKIIAKDLLAQQREKVAFPPDLKLSEMMREAGVKDNDHRIYEFIGSDTFGAEWNERRRYEVDAGRDQEPILYEPIYSVVRDANLPRVIDIFKLGPGGVVFEEVQEGGEVKFATITSSEETVRIRHYGVGLEYSKDLVVYNDLWRVPIVERQAGIAYNALLNHIHLSPFIDYTYTSANQTAANTDGTTLIEDYMLTIEDAILNSRTDQTNPRRGPYALLVSTANLFTVEKALTRVPQQGVTLQSSAIDAVQAVIAYDGWTGTRGGKSTTYSGVSSGTAYLIDLANRDMDHQSYIKQDLMQDGMEEDVSRFMTQVVWDTYFGAYTNPLRSTEELTWPTV